MKIKKKYCNYLTFYNSNFKHLNTALTLIKNIYREITNLNLDCFMTIFENVIKNNENKEILIKKIKDNLGGIRLVDIMKKHKIEGDISEMKHTHIYLKKKFNEYFKTIQSNCDIDRHIEYFKIIVKFLKYFFKFKNEYELIIDERLLNIRIKYNKTDKIYILYFNCVNNKTYEKKIFYKVIEYRKYLKSTDIYREMFKDLIGFKNVNNNNISIQLEKDNLCDETYHIFEILKDSFSLPNSIINKIEEGNDIVYTFSSLENSKKRKIEESHYTLENPPKLKNIEEIHDEN